MLYWNLRGEEGLIMIDPSRKTSLFINIFYIAYSVI